MEPEILEARIAKEFVLRPSNKIGLLHDVSKLLGEVSVNIMATANWVVNDTAVLHLMTDDDLRAIEKLKEHNYTPAEQQVVLVEVSHRPGMLEHITDRLVRESIDLNYLYASTPLEEDKSLIVFDSTDNERAVVLINEE